MVRPNYSKERFYQQMAVNIKGQVRMLRYDCAAHLEDKDDEYFWGRLFHRFAPQKKILFLTHSRSEKGNRTTGVGHCLNYSKYLDKSFIICIDSDYRRLLNVRNIDIEHCIFQTYTYSFENHHCVPEGLNQVIRKACGCDNTLIDFRKLIERYSEILYEPLMWHLYFQRMDETVFSRYEFKKLLSLFLGHSHRNPVDYMERDLRRLEQSALAKVRRLKKNYPDVCLDTLKEEYRSIGLEPKRTYFYVRGHNIFDSIDRLLRSVCEYLLSEQKQKHLYQSRKIKKIYDSRFPIKESLMGNLQYSSYPEINWIEDDIIRFFHLENNTEK